MSQEEFLLKWNDHHASFFTIVEDLCRTEQLCDVTLACGGQVFETHKLILSVCSPYFRTLLNSRPDKHPIVYLKDVNPKHLEQLLSYMYRGEINVLQEDLGPLIETARGLQIKGLADAGDNNSRKEPKTNQNGLPSHQQSLNQPKRSRTSTPTPAPKIARIEAARPAPLPTQVLSPPSHNSLIEDDDQPIVEVDPTENSQIKQEMWMMSGSGRDGEDSNEFEIPPEQYEQDMQAEDEQYIQAGNEGLTGQQDELSCLQKRKPLNYECSECGKRFPSQWKLERHFVIHTGMRPFICPYCAKSHTQADNLKIHIKKIHPEEPIPSVEEMREMMSTAYHSPNLYSALTQDGTQ